jgi:catechol 2,3-dioxygenase-like lactoylglutathione lyase family enzyme
VSWFGAPPLGLDLYHVGIVVPDARAAMQQYSDALGFTWTELGTTTFNAAVDGYVRQARIAVTYSREGPPYLELVEELSGGVWAADALALDHVGLWTDDLAGTVQRMEAAGFPSRVRHAPAPGEPELFSYHDSGAGTWWEVVSTAFRPRLQARLDRPQQKP